MPLTKDTRSDRLSLAVMPAQPDIAGMLAKPNEESRDSILRPIFDFDSIKIGLGEFAMRRPTDRLPLKIT